MLEIAEGIERPKVELGRVWEVGERIVREYGLGEVTVVLVDDAQIAGLNRKFLGRDFPTDVIAFDLRGDPAPEGPSGEVYVSLERAEEQAQEFGVPLEEEVARLMFHGLLHLAGFEDGTPEEAESMDEEIERYLRIWREGGPGALEG